MPTKEPVLQDMVDPNNKSVINLSGIAADIVGTVLLRAPVTGLYLVSAYMVCTTTGTGDTVPTLAVGFTDQTGSNTILGSSPANPTKGSNASTAFFFYCVAGQNILGVLAAGSYLNGSVYALNFSVQRMS